ncbi:MAG: cell division protein FtsX [Bacteroidales bacterium]|nr:cell division protein FtsX [Bacteroidales bacterium]
MPLNEEKFTQRKLTGSYITSVVSITLVLFTIGLFGIIILNANKLSDLIKENIGFEIILKDGVREAGIIQLQKLLDANPHVKSTYYITKEEATKRLSEDLGEDFIQWLGEDENPLLPTIEVRFRAEWGNSDSLAMIEQKLLQNTDVKEVYYQKSLVDLINQNIRRIALVLFVFVVLLLTIAIALINNTIRLSVYAKRFLIRSMQLVGATEGFIRRPFVITGIVQGLIGAVFASLLLSLMLYVGLRSIPEMAQLQDYTLLGVLFAVLLLLGMLLTGVSTFFALRKFLRSSTDKLFV